MHSFAFLLKNFVLLLFHYLDEDKILPTQDIILHMFSVEPLYDFRYYDEVNN